MNKELSKYQKRHIEFVNNKVAKAIMDSKLIEKGDKVLVAVSGGKDSLVLLDALSTLRRYELFDFNIEALHINMVDVPYQINHSYLNKLCSNLDVKLSIMDVKSEIDDRGKKAPCFVCSWHRRKALFTYANDNGFKKLALGHHMDDAIETMLINMAYHGNISSLPAKLSMFDDKINLIRPLILLTNKDTTEFANIRQFKKLKEACPHEDKTKRTTARELIKQMQSISPDASRNLFRSMGNIDEDYLP